MGQRITFTLPSDEPQQHYSFAWSEARIVTMGGNTPPDIVIGCNVPGTVVRCWTDHAMRSDEVVIRYEGPVPAPAPAPAPAAPTNTTPTVEG